MSPFISRVIYDSTEAAYKADKSTKGRTSITPFEKILEENTETKKTEINEVEKTADKTTSASGGNQTLDSIFREAAAKYNVPYELLVAVAKAESNFNTDATSGKGAQGIMQLMPATAKDLGVTDSYDVKQNIMAGAKYLGAHLEAFDNDMDKAIAAYNAGGTAVRKYNGVPPYEETQNYVKIVNKYMKEGVTVPDKKIQTDGTAETSNGNSAASTAISDAVAATEEELVNSIVVVGTGESAVTMTYGAYQRYLELGSSGVG